MLALHPVLVRAALLRDARFLDQLDCSTPSLAWRRDIH